MIKIRNKEELDKIIAESANKLCIVKFSADWCGPCKVLGNVIKQYISEYAPADVEFAEIDVDEVEEELLESYSVKSVPVLVYFKDELVVNKTVGLINKPELHKIIEETKLK